MQCVIFIGIPATGKSTYFQSEFVDTHIRINLDMLKTRHRETLFLNTCFEAKQPFVVDNTNPSRVSRERYINLAKIHGFEVVGYYFQSRLSDALERNESRSRIVPVAGVRSVAAALELPRWDEGFDGLKYVLIGPDGFEVSEWENENE